MPTDRAHPVAFMWTTDFSKYHHSPDHPLNPFRLELTVDLLRSAELLHDEETVKPQPATVEDVALVHTPAYIDHVQAVSAAGYPLGDSMYFGLGSGDNPVFKDMHAAALLITGASLAAADTVMQGRAKHAFNIAGGLHHALPDQAAGFCVYNDPAIVIAHLQQRYGSRTLYIDLDAHHGDGVQWIFYAQDDTVTFSLHETGRYIFPGTGGIEETGSGPGRGFSVNVPLEPFTRDASWLECLQIMLEPLCEAFRPDVIVSQHGCDAHAWDPLTHLSVTTGVYDTSARLIHDLAHTYCDGRWIALGGGGYDIWRVVPRAWTLVWGALAQRPFPDKVPAAWLERWSGASPVALPEDMVDTPAEVLEPPADDGVAERNRDTAQRSLDQALIRMSKGLGRR